MIKKILALAAIALMVVAAPAHAGGGYADEDTITCTPSTVPQGGSFTCPAQVFEPGSSVTFTLFSAPVTLGTATANDAGVATLQATIPANTTPGTHTVEASGTGADGAPLTVSTSITVTGASGVGGTGTGRGGNIPRTGSSSTLPMTQIALGAPLAGGLLLLVANKRRSAKAGSPEMAGV